MKRPTLKAKALAIDLKKNKIIIGGLALIAGLMAMGLFSLNAHAKDTHPWSSYSFGENESKFPLQMAIQKMGH